ncbi:lysine methyltransferase SMYD2 [Seminavis robusta]|uniref:Lysine methyltransferase SMYD2 n=1 Tax=Seminavis robusta TaxID=568900 RepID=A0A9N8E2V6_9STRA|nr:lysine methyltransferase SMYD2 [Seminavis robusta]|eukprot:Sro600_g173380.1 lysine methyltransferase SMYD2 (338) ;mRNA; r:23005-24018
MERPFCAFCYASSDKLLKCGQCLQRLYCSAECQRNDWKTKPGGGCHKLYCGIAGEINVDYEIKDTGKDGVGVGVFALREFDKNDMILTERPILKVVERQLVSHNINEIPKTAAPLFESLLPVDGRFQQKWDKNAMDCTGEEDAKKESGLFLVLSRINHDCLGNADHQYLAHRGIKILVAAKHIPKGHEITISYLGSFKPKHERNIRLLSYPFHFICRCDVCTNDELDQKLARTKDLDRAILTLGAKGKIEVAMRKGRALLSLYEQLQQSTWLYQRTYYDLFQVAITKKKYYKDAMHFMEKAHEAALAYTQDPQHPQVLRLQELLISPETHRNYRIIG